jgi:hypothetical protein
MIVNIKELYTGKATIIKNKQYYSAEKYCKPFIERLEPLTEKFIINVQTPDQLTGSRENWDVVFNKVSIMAILKSEVEDYKEVIGFCYALDVKKPIAKFYRAFYNEDNGNILAHDESMLELQEIEEDEILGYSVVDKLLEKTSDFSNFISNFEHAKLTRQLMDTYLGSWVRGCVNEFYLNDSGKIKVSPKDAIATYVNFCVDRDSEYYLGDEQEFSKLDLFENFLSNITNDKKDIMNKFEKSLIIKKIIA